MELRHIRYFTAVAEELSFSRAAKRLHVSPPSLSTQVRQLEERVGAQLLKRDTHHVALTPAGRAFLKSSRRIVGELENCIRFTRRVGRGEAGQLSVGFVASLGHGLMPALLQAYREKFPEVELTLCEMETSSQIEALQAHRLDVGLIGLGVPADPANLELTPIIEEKLVVALPSGHPLTRGPRGLRRSLPLAALAKERFVLASRASPPVFNPWIIVLCQQAGFYPQLLQEAGGPVTALNYVAAGLGVTILPAQFSRMSTYGVSFIPLAPPVPPYRYCAAWSPRNRHSSLVNFITTAKTAARAAR